MLQLSVSELCDRYGIKSRKSLYSRLEGLKIRLNKDKTNKSYATQEQLALLDQQNDHIKKGGTIATFVPTTQGEVTVHNNTSFFENKSVEIDAADAKDALLLLAEIGANLAHAIAASNEPSDPLWYLGKLEIARASGWELTTSEVKKLIGVKPICKKGERIYRRGSFILIKSGKIGNQTSWRVQKQS